MTQLECGCRRNEELNACKSGFFITRKKHEQRLKQLSSAVQFVKAVANLDSGQQKGHTSSPSAYRRLEPLHTPPWLACLNPDRVSKGLALIDWKDCKSRWRWWLISGFRSIVKGMMQNFGDICIILIETIQLLYIFLPTRLHPENHLWFAEFLSCQSFPNSHRFIDSVIILGFSFFEKQNIKEKKKNVHFWV